MGIRCSEGPVFLHHQLHETPVVLCELRAGHVWICMSVREEVDTGKQPWGFRSNEGTEMLLGLMLHLVLV